MVRLNKLFSNLHKARTAIGSSCFCGKVGSRMNGNNLSKAYGHLSIVVCAFLWSTAGLFIRLIDWNPFWIAGLRSLIAGVFLFAIVRTVRLNWSWPLVGAAVSNAACMILFVVANKLTTSADAILIQYWAPVGTAALGFFFLRERMRWEQVAALAGTLVGLILLFGDPASAWGALGAIWRRWPQGWPLL